MYRSNANRQPLCVNRCGFYGSEETRNMCSNCYNHYIQTQLIDQTVKALDRLSISDTEPLSSTQLIINEADFALNRLSLVDTKSSNPSVSLSDTSFKIDSVSNTLNTSELGSNSGSRSKKSRCKNCNKKVGLIGFKCRCGGLFCAKHRYAMEHSCTFDYKKFDREIMIKQNHLIKADKLPQRI